MLTMFPKFELVPLYDFKTFGILHWVIDVSPLACLWVLPACPTACANT
jgi:hypothetical protein